jgi:hypothetical protein
MAAFFKPRTKDLNTINLSLVWIVQPYVKKETDDKDSYWLKLGFVGRTEFVQLQYENQEDQMADFKAISNEGPKT